MIKYMNNSETNYRDLSSSLKYKPKTIITDLSKYKYKSGDC